MRLGVHLSRLSQLPLFEGAIRIARRRGHRVWLLLDTHLAGGPKADQVPSSAQIPARFAAWAEFVSVTPDGLAGLISGLRVDWVLTGYAPHLAGWRPSRPTRLGFLQGAVTDLTGLDDPGRWDRVYAWSEHWRTIWHQWTYRDDEHVRAMNRAFRPVGYPLGDHLRWTDPEEVRATFGLGGKPVVVLAPFPFHANTRSLWADCVWGWPWPWIATDRRFVNAVRDFCDRAGASLVVKARAKVITRAYVRETADRIVEDQPGEPTMLRLLTASRLLLHACSTSAMEAAAAGTWAYCLSPSARQWPAYAGRRRMPGLDPDPEMGPSLYHWPVLSLSCDPRQMILLLKHSDLPIPPSEVSRTEYAAAFLGGLPFRAGARIMDDLETGG